MKSIGWLIVAIIISTISCVDLAFMVAKLSNRYVNYPEYTLLSSFLFLALISFSCLKYIFDDEE